MNMNANEDIDVDITLDALKKKKKTNILPSEQIKPYLQLLTHNLESLYPRRSNATDWALIKPTRNLLSKPIPNNDLHQKHFHSSQ
jgi:hypothetical protein